MNCRVSFKVSALGFGLAFLCLAGSETPAGAQAPDGFSDVVIFATNSVLLKKDASATGDVVVNDATAGPHLDHGYELSLDKNVAIDGVARADSVRLKQGAGATGGVECNDGSGVSCGGLALPVFGFLPAFQPSDPRPDAPDVTVPPGGSATLAEGEYGHISVGAGGSVVFTGGLYQARSIAGGAGSSLLFDGASDVRLVGRLRLAKESTLGPSDGAAIGAESIIVYVGGINGQDGGLHSEPKAARFAKECSVSATLYVPNGTLLFKMSAVARGSFLARDFMSDKDGEFVLDSFYANKPPTADAQEVFTEGETPLDIILSGSDPEGGSLAFSIVSDPSEGSLGPITPIVPPPVGHCSESAAPCLVDADCPGGEICILQQPATTSAEVTYTPTGPCPIIDEVVTCPEDSFLFAVTDPEGLSSDPAEVGINAPGDTTPPPDPLEDVVAHATTVETLLDTAVTVTLHGSAPCVGECDGVDDVELTFSIVAGSGPFSGVLGPLTQGSGTPQRTASVDYTPNLGFAGADSFDFQVAGDTNGDGDTDDPGETSTATATIEVQAPAPPQDPVADPVVATTEMNTEVLIGLSGTPGTQGGAPLALPMSLGSGFDVGDNGQIDAGASRGVPPGGPTPITIGAGWTATLDVPPAFFWQGIPPVLSTDGPFTFDGEACVSVTDDFQKGDQFRLIDNGTELGSTPLVAVDEDSTEVGPDAAYADSTWSSGSFEVGDGSHSIDIEILPPNSFPTGRGYIRVDSLDSAFCSDTCGLTFTVEDPPTSGTVGFISQTSTTTAEILYTPNQGFVGIDSFVYGVTDCFGNLAIAPVDLTIIDVNACTNCYTLTVQLAGTGAGDVTSNPTGIACPSSSCAADFTQNSAVILQARPVDEFVFSGWSGDCSGGSPLLTVVLDSDKTCTATFSDGQ
jgi:hypothetical protein